jgi:hypothetical protein
MKNRKTTAFIGLAFLLAAVPLLSNSQDDPEALINRARSVIQDPHFSRDAITDSLSDALGAALLILPETDYAEDFRARIETVRKMVDDEVLFSDKGRQYLGLAYKMVSGGKSWQVPEELKTLDAKKGIERSFEICQISSTPPWLSSRPAATRRRSASSSSTSSWSSLPSKPDSPR